MIDRRERQSNRNSHLLVESHKPVSINECNSLHSFSNAEHVALETLGDTE
jgi:hypothetical protein